MAGRTTRTVYLAAGLTNLTALAANNYDGTYKGQVTLTHGDQSTCGTSSFAGRTR